MPGGKEEIFKGIILILAEQAMKDVFETGRQSIKTGSKTNWIVQQIVFDKLAHYTEKVILYPGLIPHIKVSPQWVKDLSIKGKIMNVIGKKQKDIFVTKGQGENFFNSKKKKVIFMDLIILKPRPLIQWRTVWAKLRDMTK